jgi:hypothetical protein
MQILFLVQKSRILTLKFPKNLLIPQRPSSMFLLFIARPTQSPPAEHVSAKFPDGLRGIGKPDPVSDEKMGIEESGRMKIEGIIEAQRVDGGCFQG